MPGSDSRGKLKDLYPYEQTVVMLPKAVFDKRAISRFFIGSISDLREGGESRDSAMQQAERAERVLKALWRERDQSQPDWIGRYRRLEAQSEQVRRTALTILESFLA